MSLFSLLLLPPGPRELHALQIAFDFYALVSFFVVTGYAATQLRAGRLIQNENSPISFVVPEIGPWFFIVSIMALLFLQSPLYVIFVLLGVGVLVLANGRTPQEQFGLGRLLPSRVLAWSLLACGAVVFVEIPLIKIIETAMSVVHLPHPQQESVEIFRQLNKPSQIAGFMLQAVLLYPIIEELFFRGFLLTFLKNYTSTLGAIFLSAGIFAFAHANLDSAIPLWFLGIVLGIAYQHTGSLLLPIGIHACWNFFTAISLILEKGNS